MNIAWSKRLESFVKIISKNSISGEGTKGFRENEVKKEEGRTGRWKRKIEKR